MEEILGEVHDMKARYEKVEKMWQGYCEYFGIKDAKKDESE